VQLPGCKLQLKIKSPDGSAEKSTLYYSRFPGNDAQNKSIKRLSCQNLIHPGGRKRDQNEGWVLFQWFPFSVRRKKEMKRKGCKSTKSNGGC